ncbi:MAG: HEAT repeat domain-containing protein [Saprospiraceae bacterium]|nr:HEAT repeat domain-containing protein [Saprospiraceae bacterium]
MLTFFRAFHFQPTVNKDGYLAPLLTGNHPQQKRINAYTLSNLSPSFYQQSKQKKALVEALLPTIEGTPEWLDAITSMRLSNQAPALLKMLLHEADKDMQYGAAKALTATNDKAVLSKLFQQLAAEDKMTFLETIGKVGNKDANQFLIHMMNQRDLPLSLRQSAAASVAGNWEGSFSMVEMINNNQLDEALKPIVALKLINAWAPEVKEAGMKILQKIKRPNNYRLSKN